MRVWIDDIGVLTLVRDNGDKVRLTHQELEAIDAHRQTLVWRYGIEDEVKEEEGNLCFDEISREEFIDLCLQEIVVSHDCYGSDNTPYKEPDYADIVFNVAENEDIWRE